MIHSHRTRLTFINYSASIDDIVMEPLFNSAQDSDCGDLILEGGTCSTSAAAASDFKELELENPVRTAHG